MEEEKTPCLDELEKGPWPSYVTQLKALAEKKPKVKQLLQLLERSYKEKRSFWEGAILMIPGYGGGIIGRQLVYLPREEVDKKFPDIFRFHTFRIMETPGYVYSTKSLRELCDISEKYSSGILQFHGMTGDILMLGSNDEETYAGAEELLEKGWDIGGAGPDLRTPSGCIGPAYCEWAMFDTLKVTKFLTDTFLHELHLPAFPYKFKIKCSGCANDCGASIQRADLPIIGTWRDKIQINEEEVEKFIKEKGEEYVIDTVIARCPTRCISLKSVNGKKKIKIDDDNCVKCMHCIDMMPKALAPGKDRGVTILIGGKSSLIIGDILSTVLIPFMKLETDEDYNNLVSLIRRIWKFWDENGLDHERVGEFIDRVGMGTFLEGIGVEPDPRMVKHPRQNCYIFFRETSPRISGEPPATPQAVDREVESEETTL